MVRTRMLDTLTRPSALTRRLKLLAPPGEGAPARPRAVDVRSEIAAEDHAVQAVVSEILFERYSPGRRPARRFIA